MKNAYELKMCPGSPPPHPVESGIFQGYEKDFAILLTYSRYDCGVVCRWPGRCPSGLLCVSSTSVPT